MLDDDDARSPQPETGPDRPAPWSRRDRAGRTAFACCAPGAGEGFAGCPCGSFLSGHPLIASAFLALMGLTALVVLTGAVLGLIAFFRTT